MGPPASHRITRVLWYSGVAYGISSFRLRGFHPLCRDFPDTSTTKTYQYLQSTTPRLLLVWALSRSLAATWKIDVSFSSSSYLDVSVRWVTLYIDMDSLCDICLLKQMSSLIRKSTDRRLFAPPRSLSQLVTSFFGS